MASRSSLFHSPLLLLGGFFFVLIVILGASRLSHSADGDGIAPNELLVETLGAYDGGLAPARDRYIGRVEAGRRVELGFDIASVLTKITRREGESFNKGDLLASLDARRLRAQQTELKANLARSIASLKLAEASLKRIQGLRRSGNVSEQSLDEALRQKEAAMADRELVEAQLASVDLEIEKSKLFAPFDGVVVDRLSEEGRTVSLGVPVLLVEESGAAEIRVNVPLELAREIEPGQVVSLIRDKVEMQGRVERINLSLTSSRVSEIYVQPMDQSLALVPGELLYFEVARKQAQEGIWVPMASLVEYGRGLWALYMAIPEAESSEHAIIERTVVEILSLRGGYALVRGGLSEQNYRYVLNDATHRVVDGQRVRIASKTQVN